MRLDLAHVQIKKIYFFFPGLFMRLEPDIEPTKSRAATVSSKEMARFREIQNVVRNTKCNYTKIDFLLFAQIISQNLDLFFFKGETRKN